MRALEVNLSESEIYERDLEKYADFFGGKGVAVNLMLEEIPRGTDPLSEENILIFGTGPLNGINLSGASRATCHFKSPMTNGYGESQCGGFLAYEMKKAGLDFILIKGAAEKPVYLLVDRLWGKDAFETEEYLREKHSGEVLSIGQAGENLVRFACITHRKGRQFGRGGAGAVMGAKKLKAIVVKGKGRVEVANPEALKEFRQWLNERLRETHRSLMVYGTSGMMALVNELGVLPTRYWQKGRFDGAEKISGEELKKHFVKDKSCYGCYVGCGKLARANGAETEIEYETLFALGALCENSDLARLLKAAELCDRYGMDTITTGNVIAYWMALGKADFGDAAKALELVDKIAFRRDEGDLLAEGVKEVAERLKAEVEPVHVKGLEPAGYDPRGLFGIAIGYATSPRGACHMRSCAYRPNLTGHLKRLSTEGQAEMVKDYEDFYAVMDSMVYCRFLCLPIIGPIYWEELSRLYEIVTGEKVEVEQFKRVGERINNLAREFNLREGVKDYSLPKTLLKDIGEENFQKMLSEYFRLRGWS